jgi:hypothetical protein
MKGVPDAARDVTGAELFRCHAAESEGSAAPKPIQYVCCVFKSSESDNENVTGPEIDRELLGRIGMPDTSFVSKIAPGDPPLSARSSKMAGVVLGGPNE